jgi:hypothetical protein
MVPAPGEEGHAMRAWVLLAALALTACGTVIPAIPSQPLAGQSPQQEEQGARECAEAAEGTNAFSYEACMIPRKHKVVFHLLGNYQPEPFRGEMPLIVEIAATAPRTPEQVAQDIDACRTELRKDDATLTYGGYIEPNKPIKLAARYANCMQPSGKTPSRDRD